MQSGSKTTTKSKKSEIERQVLAMQSENKQQYKRLADAINKSQQYSRVQEALTLDKHMKEKGKKRKIEEADGRTSFKWFSERKR